MTKEKRRIDIPLYPADGGLFPFMIDYGGGLCCWKTNQKDASLWKIVYWDQGTVIELGKMSIADMILGFLEAKPQMVRIWGDVRQYEPQRIRLTETSEPKKNEAKSKKRMKQE